MTDIVLELGDEHYNIDMGDGFVISPEVRFLDLVDTPESYVGQARLIPRVEGTENGLEFYQPGIGDLRPKDHHLLDGLTDDDHPLYLRHDGQRELTGDLIPDVDGELSLGDMDNKFSSVHTESINSHGSGLILTTGGKLTADVYDILMAPSGNTHFDCDTVFHRDIDWTSGKSFPRVYEGGVIPSMDDGEWAMWHDTDNEKYWLVFRKDSVSHRVELKGGI